MAPRDGPSQPTPLNDLRLQQFLLQLPVLMFSIVAHEYAHGYAALKQGDQTALMLGRLTFNPLKHIDPFMTVLLPVFLAFSGFPVLAGAKPVPVNPRNYRNYKRGDIIVSLAGIATNLVLAVIFAVLVVLIGLIPIVPSAAETQALLQAMFGWGVVINLMLAMFNLLPVPPLDGSHVLKYLLPPAWSLNYQRVGFLGLFILLFLMRTPFLRWWLAPAYLGFYATASIAQHVSMLLPHVLAPWGGG
jgi:Zn-dependent protease